MKKRAVNNSNGIVERIKRDLSNIREMFVSPNEVTENEVTELGNDLGKSLEKIDAYAQKYQNSIGVPSKSKKQVQVNAKNQQNRPLSIQSKTKKEKNENKDSEREY